MGTNFGALGRRARAFPTGSTVEMFIVAAVCFWVLLVVIGGGAISQSMTEPLVSQLRLIAQEPLPERNDPRFKQWKDLRTRFPAPPEGRVGEPVPAEPEGKPVKAAGAWFWRPLGRALGLAWGRFQKAATQR